MWLTLLAMCLELHLAVFCDEEWQGVKCAAGAVGRAISNFKGFRWMGSYAVGVDGDCFPCCCWLRLHFERLDAWVGAGGVVVPPERPHLRVSGLASKLIAAASYLT